MAEREILSACMIPPVAAQEDCKLFPTVVPLIPGKENAPPYTCPVYVSVPHPSVDVHNVSFDMIYQFMVDRKRPTDDMESVPVKSFKALDRAVSHFQAGDVSEVMAAEVECDIMYVKAKVKASMKKQQYSAWICFWNGRPIHAYCQCPIGLAQCCSHVGGILFALNDYTRQKTQTDMQLACTSKLAAWKKPRKMNLDPKPFNQLEFTKPKLSNVDPKPDKSSSIEFDPRHTNDRNIDQEYYQQKLMELKKIFPKTGMGHLCQIYEETPPVASVEEIETLIDPMDIEINMMIYSTTNRPPQQIGQDLVNAIEKRTRGQRNCSLWLDLHKGRLTSSRFGDIMSSGESPKRLVSEIINGSCLEKYTKMPLAVQWGIDKEDTARREYVDMMRQFGHPISVEASGLFLIPYASYIGASCDGIITDKSLPEDVQRGVLEIKCPYSINKTHVNTMDVPSIIDQYPSFYLKVVDGEPELDKCCKYYAQVQGEMAATGLTWCDFVVWTACKSNNIFIQRIQFDSEFVSQMLPCLQNFYAKFIDCQHTNNPS